MTLLQRSRGFVLRGVTMLEMMTVLALLGIIAALAAPNLLPITKKARLNTEGEAVASFLNAVRERAIAKNRCYRVLIGAGNTSITAEERGSGDCASTASLVGIDNWLPATSRIVADKGTTYNFGGADCAACVGTTASEIIFRPSGRLRGDNDLSTTDDRVRIRVTQSGLTEQKHVIVMGSGRICVIHVNGAGPAMNPATAQNDCSLAIP